MNYNYIFSTGIADITDSRPFIKPRNVDARYVEGGFILDSSIISGANQSLLSFNSQTLLEEEEITVQLANKTYAYVNTGDFYLDETDTRYPYMYKFQGINVSGGDVVFYDQRYSGAAVVLEKTSTGDNSWYDESMTDLLALVDAQEPASSIQEMEQNWLIYFNGQKVVDLEYITDLDRATGTIFAYQKFNTFAETISGDPDVYGTGFLGGQVSYYINGMEAEPSNFLEMYTGVTTIQTGVSSYVPLIKSEILNYSL